MHGVTAWQYGDIHYRIEQVLHTYGAILVHGILDTRMYVPKRIFITRATTITMEEVVATTNSAYAAFITVVLLLLCLIIKELALVAEVSTHANTTVFAHLLHILLMITKRANNLLNAVPWNIMAP